MIKKSAEVELSKRLHYVKKSVKIRSSSFGSNRSD